MSQGNKKLSPRQKMINLMYIVLTAMLALNVSSDVLDGFTQVQDGLMRTNESVAQRNSAIYAELEAFSAQNPERVRYGTIRLRRCVTNLNLCFLWLIH